MASLALYLPFSVSRALCTCLHQHVRKDMASRSDDEILNPASVRVETRDRRQQKALNFESLLNPKLKTLKNF